MADEVKATEGAKALAEEKDVDLSLVEGTGKDGQVTKGDVEAMLSADAEEESPPEKLIYAEFNPKMAPTDRLVLTNGVGEERVFTGDPQTRIVTESELEDYNRAPHPPTAEYPRGFKYLIRGRDAS